MRYVSSVSSAAALANLENINARLAKAQQAATSGLKHAKASEDPTWYDTQTRTNASLARNAQFQQNVTTAQGRLQRSDGVLDQATQVITRLQELSVQMANGTYSAAERADAATEVQSMKQSMIALGNERDQDGYLFGGYKSNVPPYDASGTFVGDGSDRSVAVGLGLTAVASVSGPQAFDMTVFDTISTALSANDPAAVTAGLSNITGALDQVTQARTQAGDRLNILDRQFSRLDAENAATQSERSNLVEADPIATYTEIAQATSALQAAMKVSAQSIHASLFDYL